MLDLNKPIETRDGRDVEIIATGVRAAVPEVGSHRQEGQTVLARCADDGLAYFFEDGKFDKNQYESPWDLINPPPPPVRKERYINLGSAYANVEHARKQWRDFPVMKVILEDDKLISSELLP